MADVTQSLLLIQSSALNIGRWETPDKRKAWITWNNTYNRSQEHFKLRSSLKADFYRKQGATTAVSKTEFGMNGVYSAPHSIAAGDTQGGKWLRTWLIHNLSEKWQNHGDQPADHGAGYKTDNKRNQQTYHWCKCILASYPDSKKRKKNY